MINKSVVVQKMKIVLVVFFFGVISCKQKETKTIEEKPALTYDEMTASKEESKAAFNDAKYGMFIHWGLYSIPGGIWKGKKMEELRGPRVAEWIQFGAQIPRDEYAQLATAIQPNRV